MHCSLYRFNIDDVDSLPTFMSSLSYFISGKMIGLPTEFLTNEEGSKGGGVIQVIKRTAYLAN